MKANRRTKQPPRSDTSEPTKATLLRAVAPWGQEHLLQFWDELDSASRATLAADIGSVDFELLSRLIRKPEAARDRATAALSAQGPPALRLSDAANRAADAVRCGAAALAAGEVGVVLVAGGQGTRLGFEAPKGTYAIGPVSRASLFQILLEKVAARARRHGAPIPLYVMTSPATHAPTAEFLGQHAWFGMDEADVKLFCQGTMPAADATTGRVLLAEKGRLQLSPDGHGGLLAALVASGSLDDMRRRGVRHLFYMQVDNPLVQAADAEFIGHHLLAGSELSTQVVAKRTPTDRVGNVVSIDGRVEMIEYSDLPDEVAHRRQPDGSLSLWAGNIAVHVFDVAFLVRMARQADSLPFHVARKTVPYVDASGTLVDPTAPNAIKFERFIFDLLPAAKCPLVVEVDEGACFAPLKNAEGQQRDSPWDVRSRLMALHRRWLREVGATVPDDVLVEISPLFALDAEELATKVPPRTSVTAPCYLR